MNLEPRLHLPSSLPISSAWQVLGHECLGQRVPLYRRPAVELGPTQPPPQPQFPHPCNGRMDPTSLKSGDDAVAVDAYDPSHWEAEAEGLQFYVLPKQLSEILSKNKTTKSLHVELNPQTLQVNGQYWKENPADTHDEPSVWRETLPSALRPLPLTSGCCP